jgi:minor histocompatibility antigen H13
MMPLFTCLTLMKTSISLLRTLIGTKTWTSYDKIHVSIRKGTHDLGSSSLRTPSMFLFPLACVPSLLYTLSIGRKSALLTNVLGMSFSHNALSLLKIDSFKTGTILLSGLFVYDIWWVFGTEVVSPQPTSINSYVVTSDPVYCRW